ncbi:hypothetical protein CHCC14820_3476 [Bacillus paralicheniformis]|uniref:Uncharacterized protein n=2 Tax=Bacillus paralicheniformis TaxID=1648923 RepID=A0A7Z0WXP4_9BACI|nr:hypothetical protein B4121_2893 [Bacillus paralicheniformis]OLG03612.1 hypothetical protein B4123_4157 [Bacillus paralicheniformis]OLG08475.1 hypothetical protein B4123_3705 [Bacillus paralicheniformis]TWJ35162.1 hypothetical protein CHCC5027_2914 [Bacillus paralicheniformis]TWJ49368.1 hypothetical protein CHCC5023_1551 [Bacillus paralicheniformis]
MFVRHGITFFIIENCIVIIIKKNVTDVKRRNSKGLLPAPEYYMNRKKSTRFL